MGETRRPCAQDSGTLERENDVSSVLIIDDEKNIRELFSEALEDAGYDVHLAADGDSGIRAFDRHTPDVVIVDVFMPEKDGIETILEISLRKTRARIIAISGGGFSQNFQFLDMTQRLGADVMLYKPVLPDKIVACVDELIGRSG